MVTIEHTNAVSEQDKAFLRDVKQLIQGFLPTSKVLLYGSYARGTQDSESDYDILVLTSQRLSATEEDVIYKALFELEIATGAAVSTMFCDRRQWDTSIVRVSPFHLEIERDAIEL